MNVSMHQTSHKLALPFSPPLLRRPLQGTKRRGTTAFCLLIMHEATGTRRRRLSSEAQSAVRTAETGGYRLGTERERRKAPVPLCVPPLRARKRGKSHSSICGAKKSFFVPFEFPRKKVLCFTRKCRDAKKPVFNPVKIFAF